MTTGGSWRGRVALVVGFALVALVAPVSSAPAPAAAPAAVPAGVAPGAGTARPRVLYAPGQEAMLRDRLQREPYRTVFAQTVGRAQSFIARTPGDYSIEAQRDLSRAAKTLAFMYALDRTYVDGRVVPFASPSVRQYTGAIAATYLTKMYERSRMAVPAPLGAYDRDINTSEEIVNYATAFDTLLGAGWNFGANRAVIVQRLSAVTNETYVNYVHPETANNGATLNQNNHRSKVGAALAIAAVVLADDAPAARDWWDYGVLQVDDVLRYMLITGDGAYAEGPFYYRYTAQNLLPFLRVWERVLGAQSWTVGTVTVPAYLHHPLYARTFRWMLDTTVPDGTMAPIDDANPGRSYYFGAAPPVTPDAAAGYWRWADTPQALDTDGSVEMGPDTIVSYDDSIVPAPPTWSPTQFYVEGGTATFRSSWSGDAVMALVLGEHDTASEFGRDRLGLGRSPESHEHADPGAYSLYAYGQELLLDPGYVSFTQHGQLNQAVDHNVVLVDGKGPVNLLGASLAWASDPAGRPPVDGQSTISDTIDGGGFDAATVTSRYGTTPAKIQRRFLFVDDRYLVVGDSVASSTGASQTYTWPIQGNGGGTSGGTFTALPTGGRWEIAGGRVDAALGFDTGAPTLTTAENQHEVPYGQLRTHTMLQASVTAPAARSVQILYPTPAGSPAPVQAALTVPGAAAAQLTDATGDRRIAAARRASSGATMTVGSLATDGSTALVDTHLDGRLRLASADDATVLKVGAVRIGTRTRGTLAVRLGDGTADVVADDADPIVDVSGLGFVPKAVDGACGWQVLPDGTVRLSLGRERRVTLRAATGNSAPAADAGADQRVGVGASVGLDGRRSCDTGGGTLTPKWELVSAPGGSTWSLTGATGWTPQLKADRAGPYRVRLTVTDAQGAKSRVAEVVVTAGPRDGDGVDDDLDGLIDTDDADHDGVGNRNPVAGADTYSVAADHALGVGGPGLLANDSDPDGDRLDAAVLTGPAHGQLLVWYDGSVIYVPNAGFRGTDSFTYVARDGSYAESPPTSVTLHVT